MGPAGADPRRARRARALAWLLAARAATWARAAVPAHPPGPLSFYDHDADSGQIGGVFEFIKAASEADVTHYVTYWGSSPTTRLLPLANLTADGHDAQYSIPLNTPVPQVQGVAASHFITFSANADGENPDGVSLAFRDRGVPLHAPAGLAFEDEDYLHGLVGGRATISRAADEGDVLYYLLYFGSGPTSLLVAATGLLSPPAGPGPLVHVLANGTQVPQGATHLLAFSANNDGISQTAAAAGLRDRALPDYPAIIVQFSDSDMARGEISGLVFIGRATSEALVEAYAIYTASGPGGPLVALLGLVDARGADLTFLIPADTPMPVGVTHLVVRTRNADGEMATGVSTPIYDVAVPAHQAEGIAFDDVDVDPYEVAGTITVTGAADESDIDNYFVFFADDLLQPLTQMPIAALAKGPAELNHTLGESTPVPPGATRLLVLTGNHDGLMTSGASTPLVDRAVPVHPPQGVVFTDVDTDAGELGGSLTVFRASDEADVSSYTAYFGSSGTADFASIHTAIGAASVGGLSGGVVVFTVFANTPIPAGATHLLAFSRNADGEMRSGVSAPILDATGAFPTVAVAGLGFVDQDPLLGSVGGPLAWTEPGETLGLTSYTAFLSVDEAGTMQQQLLGPLAVGSPGAYRTAAVPLATPLATMAGQAAYLVVYTNNNQGRGPGAALPLVDRAVPVSAVLSLAFADVDPAEDSVGGLVQWAPPPNPGDATRFTGYAVYLAGGAAGAGRSRQGEVPAGTNALAIPQGTELRNLTHVLVFTKNAMGEAASGPAAPIADRVLPSAAVGDLSFVDQDLGTGEIGGRLEWSEPADPRWVERYAIYLVDAEGARQSLGEAPVGSAYFAVPFDTQLANFSDVAVVAANAIGEALVNASLPLVDRTVQSCPSSTSHGMASSRWRVVAGPVAGTWRVRAVRFYEDALCARRLATLPRGWPRRPRQAAGSPFSTPPSLRNLHGVFLVAAEGGGTWANGTRLEEGGGRALWSAAGPCPASNASGVPASMDLGGAECSLGFSWESSATTGPDGRIRGSSGTVQASKKAVHCVEVEQSEVDGEYATSLSLQWFDEIGAQYRTLLWRPVSRGGVVQLAHQQVLAAECFTSSSR